MKLFDLHCDTAYRCYMEKTPMLQNEFHISLERGGVFSPWVQCFAIWIPDEFRGKSAVELFRKVAENFQQEMIKNADRIEQCRDFSLLPQQLCTGKSVAILTVEGGGALGGDVENLLLFEKYGAKMMTLTWNGRCELGSGVLDEEDIGLSDFGKTVVSRMETVGMIPDLSHASPRLFWDVCAHTDRPVVVSHSNLQAVCGHPRNLSDEQFGEMVRRKGLVGLNFCTYFLHDQQPDDVQHLFSHIDRMLALGGEDTIALGGDFDGTDVPAYLEGIQSMGGLREEMLRHNYKECIVDAIFFDNAYNFFDRFDKQP